jgi:hypothetical protein
MTSGTRWTASPACFTTVVATRFARATGDCRRARLRPRVRLRADDFRAAEPRADLRREVFLRADFRPPADRLRRPAFLRDDRFLVAMASLSKLRGGCLHARQESRADD